jgi:hypothetical protein
MLPIGVNDVGIGLMLPTAASGPDGAKPPGLLPMANMRAMPRAMYCAIICLAVLISASAIELRNSTNTCFSRLCACNHFRYSRCCQRGGSISGERRWQGTYPAPLAMLHPALPAFVVTVVHSHACVSRYLLFGGPKGLRSLLNLCKLCFIAAMLTRLFSCSGFKCSSRFK